MLFYKNASWAATNRISKKVIRSTGKKVIVHSSRKMEIWTEAFTTRTCKTLASQESLTLVERNGLQIPMSSSLPRVALEMCLNLCKVSFITYKMMAVTPISQTIDA